MIPLSNLKKTSIIYNFLQPEQGIDFIPDELVGPHNDELYLHLKTSIFYIVYSIWYTSTRLL